MRSRGGISLLLLVWVAVFCAASPARAWTRTVVESARATVDVEPEGTVYVLLRLDVEVHAGWLHELELVDLGEDVDLDRYRPPYLRSEEGEIFRPEAELHEDGRIRLWFERRDAPRRGQYRVYMRYRTRADVTSVDTDGSKRARLTWSVPAWETGLHDVLIEFRAPKGTRVPDAWRDTSPGVKVETLDGPRRTVVRWRRIHLPRMTAWPLALDAPEGSIAVPTVEHRAPVPDGFRALDTKQPQPIAWVTFAILLLALMKRRTVELRHGPKQLVFAAPWWLVVGAAGALALGAQLFAPSHLAWSFPIVLGALHRPLRETPLPQHRAWKRVKLNAESPPPFLDPLDATTWLGGFVLAVFSAGLFALGAPTATLLLLPLFFTGTRWHRPPGVREAHARLASFGEALRLPFEAPPMALAAERADDGATRIRLELPSTRAGLASVSLVVASARFGFVWKRRVMLVVHTRAQSDADDLMRRRSPRDDAFRTADGSVLRLVEWNDDAIALLQALSCRAPKPVKASRGTWLLRELSARGKKAA
jgi:hypothetical protein